MRNFNFFKKVLLLVAVVTYSGCSNDVQTTRQRTIVPDDLPSTSVSITIYDLAQYEANGYGKWHYGPGLDSVRRLDIMPATYVDSSTHNNKKLLNFFTISDVHITDKESPAQAMALANYGFVYSAYSGTMLYSTQVLDAAVKTINSLHNDNPFDFGISLGDSCNNSQYNEARWYIDVLDGNVIIPSSGAHDGADTIDYQKSYQATGLNKSIPWYQAVGNHDHFWMGFLPVNVFVSGESYTTDNILAFGSALFGEDYYMGAVDGSTPYGDVIGAGKVSDFSTPPKVSAADPDRRSLSRKEWMTEFLTTSSTPVGHGFTQSNVDDDFGCYSFEPKSDIPIKVIVLDDTQDNSDPIDMNSLGYGHGELDTVRYNWLVSELDAGQAAGQLMIIAAHIPIGVEQYPSPLSWDPTFETELLAKLHTYSNFILWVAGHRHLNTVTAFRSPDDAHPELGFWQIETSSLKDFPQQFRTIEIFRNEDNNISIVTVNVDPELEEAPLAAISRGYGVAAWQFFPEAVTLLPTGSYNAELVKQLSTEMQDKLKIL